MAKEHTNLRETISVPKRVGVAIRWLANGGSHRSTCQVFGATAAIACRIVKDFVSNLVHLRNKFIIWPTRKRCPETVEILRNLSQFPNILGAVDVTHVKIMPLTNSTMDFIDRKQRFSICCQAVCDGDMKVLSVSEGYPGWRSPVFMILSLFV